MLTDKQRAEIAVALTGEALLVDKQQRVVQLITDVEPVVEHVKAQQGHDIGTEFGRPMGEILRTDIMEQMQKGVDVMRLRGDDFRKWCERYFAEKPRLKYEHRKKYV